MAIRTIDDSILQGIAEAIQAKDGGGKMYDTEMRGRIQAIPSGGGSVEKKDVNFYDWEGTLLFAYSVEEVQAMTSLPAPDTSPNYQSVDHDLLTFQEWNWSLANIKAWIQAHEGRTLDVGAIYTTTDLQNHNYWNNPRLTNDKSIYMQKRGVTSIGNGAFQSCFSLTSINIPDGVTIIGNNAFQYCRSLIQVNIPDGVTSIGNNAFQNCNSLTRINIPDSVTSIGGGVFQDCYSLTRINIPDGVTSIGNNAFQNCNSLCDVLLESKPTLTSTNVFSNLPTNYRIYVPRSYLSWFETATNWSSIYTAHIVAIEDYIDYLESFGFDVDKYKEVTA